MVYFFFIAVATFLCLQVKESLSHLISFSWILISPPSPEQSALELTAQSSEEAGSAPSDA